MSAANNSEVHFLVEVEIEVEVKVKVEVKVVD